METTGGRVWFKRRQTPLTLVQNNNGIAALGEITVLLFGIQIVKHAHLCTLTSPDGNLIKSFDLFLKEKLFDIKKQDARLSITYYSFKSICDNNKTTVFYLFYHFL